MKGRVECGTARERISLCCAAQRGSQQQQDISRSLLMWLRLAAAQGCEVGAYPFASLEKVVDLFLTGATAPAAWHAKLAVLVYALADAGYEIESDSLRRAAARLCFLSDFLPWHLC